VQYVSQIEEMNMSQSHYSYIRNRKERKF